MDRERLRKLRSDMTHIYFWHPSRKTDPETLESFSRQLIEAVGGIGQWKKVRPEIRRVWQESSDCFDAMYSLVKQWYRTGTDDWIPTEQESLSAVVLFEFMDETPLDNVITCLNYKIDKVVYFGYRSILEDQLPNTTRFLKKHCGVAEVESVYIRRDDLQSTLKVMQNALEKEKNAGNRIFCDIGGGESLSLLAFGMLARQYAVPLHRFHVAENRLIEYEEGAAKAISVDVPKQKILLDVAGVIELTGGAVCSASQKSYKNIGKDEQTEDALHLWEIHQTHKAYWTDAAAFFQRFGTPTRGLTVSHPGSWANDLFAKEPKLRGLKKNLFYHLLDDLESAGLLKDVVHDYESFRFTYKNSTVQHMISDAGSSLEWYIFVHQRRQCDDAQLGVQLDWDGVMTNNRPRGVNNEVDVISVNNNIPSFFSCKIGNTTIDDLYELDTVTKRFGGKYAKKTIVLTREQPKPYMERAQEMGIEVLVV